MVVFPSIFRIPYGYNFILFIIIIVVIIIIIIVVIPCVIIVIPCYPSDILWVAVRYSYEKNDTPGETILCY